MPASCTARFGILDFASKPRWYTTEIDETAMAVASQIVPSAELHALGNTLNAKSSLSHVLADVHIGTPPCVSWSSLRSNPPGKGFDDPSATVFCASADIHGILKANNSAIKVLVENNVPHSGLLHDVSHM